jgi:hypothetical protein
MAEDMGNETSKEMEETKGKKTRRKRCMTSKQTTFAQGVAAGSSPTQAFLAAYGRQHPSDAAKQMKLPYVAEEIERMREANRSVCDLERKDLIGYLTAILFTPVARVDGEHPLAEAYELYQDGEKRRVKVKMVSKVEALKALCRMMGWWEEDKSREDRETVFYIKKMWEDGPPKLAGAAEAGGDP